MNSIDFTVLTNATIPDSWRCPYCGRRNNTRKLANEILMVHFKYLEDCESCGYVHSWQLRLTDEFKRDVVEMLKTL